MRILVISQCFWPESFRINEVVLSLSSLGHHVEVLTGKPNYPDGKVFDGYKSYGFKKERFKNIVIHRVPILPRGKSNPIKLALNYISFVSSASFYVLTNFMRHNFDVVFVYMPSPFIQAIPAVILRKLTKIPLVLYIQDLWPESLKDTNYINNNLVLNLIDAVVKFIYKQANLVLVSSKPFIGAISRYKIKAPIVYYPNSVDSRFLNIENITNLSIPEFRGEFKIVYAGNLGKAQSVYMLIELAKKLSYNNAFRLFVFGSGSQLDWLTKEAKRNNLQNIFVMGRYPYDSMPWILSQADALLLTLSNKSTFKMTVPNRLQAYMAVGKPIIASSDGEVSRLIKEANCGYSASAESSEELFNVTLKLFNMDSNQRKQLALNARNFYQENFQHDMLINKLTKYLNDLINS